VAGNVGEIGAKKKMAVKGSGGSKRGIGRGAGGKSRRRVV